MATTHEAYVNGVLGLADGDIDWSGAANVAAVLLTVDYAPDLSTHSTYADLTNEVTDADYSPVAVTTRAVDLRDGALPVDYRADDVDFGTNVSIAAAYMAFVQGDPAALDAGDRLISLHTLNDDEGAQTVSSTNSEFRVNEPTNGWFGLNTTS